MDSPDTSQASTRASTSPRVALGSHFTAEDHPQRDRVLTPEALAFIGALLARREHVQARISGGALPDFLAETRSVRDADWRVRELPSDLTDRRVEITVPTERKMVINALNSGARVLMADLEDSLSPTWGNVLNGQVNLMEDAATAEIARAQLWQWIRHGTVTAGGEAITAERFRAVLLDEQELLERELGETAYAKGHHAQAATLIDELMTAAEFLSFLTTVGYARLGNWPGSE